MSTIRDGKFYLSLCVCIQLLKIIKFTSALIPKMDLAPLVLKKALADLIFFGFVTLISLRTLTLAPHRSPAPSTLILTLHPHPHPSPSPTPSPITLTTHHSPLTTHHSPLTTHHSSLTLTLTSHRPPRLVFLISMLAFSTMFYIQLGPFLVDYATQVTLVP